MTRYYFHYHGSGGIIADEEGTDLADLDAAKEEGRVSAREVLGLDNGGPSPEYEGGTFEITNAEGQVLAIIEFRESKLR